MSEVAWPSAIDHRFDRRAFEERRLKTHGRIVGGISALGTATQFRSPGGVGPAEVALLGFMVSTWFSTRAGHPDPTKSRVFRVLALFTFFSTLGALVASSIFDADPNQLVSDLIVLYFLLMVVLYVVRQEGSKLFLSSWARTFSTAFLSSQFLLLIAAQSGTNIGIIDPMYASVRFQGWTSNPNQLAFMTVVAAVALVHAGSSQRLTRVVLLSAALLLGIASRSDGFQLALLLATMATLLLSVNSAQRSKEPRIRLVAWTALLMAGALVSIMWFQLIDKASAVAAAGNQGSDRIALWGACIRSIYQSPLTGLGPGSHASVAGLGIPMECHNSTLDVAASAGLVTAVALVALFLSLARRSWLQPDRGTLFALVQIAVMSSFGYLLRYPQLWLVLLLLEQHLNRDRKAESDASFGSVRGRRKEFSVS